jgi:hypothetical protein
MSMLATQQPNNAMDQNPIAVLDNGGSTIKAGVTNSDKSISRSAVVVVANDALDFNFFSNGQPEQF